jgi:SAM-dependent methyltransferase
MGAALRAGSNWRLFVISFVLLFFELACIRWFGSTVVFLTFFTNIVLLATFVGMSVGSLAAGGRRDWTPLTAPLLLLSIALAYGTLWSYTHFGSVMVDVGGQGSPQQVYFGTEYRASDAARFVIPIEVLGATFFALLALVFAGVGQMMGRAFTASTDRLLAYIFNIGGSLAGIAGFALLSELRAPAVAWFSIVAVLWVLLLERRARVISAASLLLAVIAVGVADRDAIWSPYYKIRYTPRAGLIETNNIGHQQMVTMDGSASGYQLPHLLNRDAGRAPFASVLIIGAGSGNDVAAALRYGATHVDAVEIDPSINDIGRADHPNRPYQDPRVTIHIDDGRSFIRRTNRTYDLIVYALVDSLVLHSGYSSLRLESFLFSQEAFNEVAAHLAPNGVFAVYNFFRQGWIIQRIDQMAANAFAAKPLVISLPYSNYVLSDEAQTGRVTFVLAGREAGLAPIRERFAASRSFWVNDRPIRNGNVNGYGPQPPTVAGSSPGDWKLIAPAEVAESVNERLPSDDWPFLYLRDRLVPALNVRSMLLLGTLSIAILFLLAPVRSRRPNWQMFMLGAGFMLLETKSVVHMTLLFGATWLVNSIVFFAILSMILASNLFVWFAKPVDLRPYYAFLTAVLLLNIIIPMSTFLALPGFQRVIASCAMTFIPIFFAGVIFGTLFRASTQPDIDYGSNIAGAVLGGLAESLSLLIGFNSMLIVALAFYLLSAWTGRTALRPALS